VTAREFDVVHSQLRAIERDGGEGELVFSRGRRLRVSSLGKPFFGLSGATKGDLMRYYARVAPYVLPAIRERPLVLKRFPDGIDGPSFYQQNAGASTPDAVRVAEVEVEKGGRAERIIGGDLLTLLYTVQIGTIAVHAWLSRLPSIDVPDYSVIDLDPGDDVPFAKVVECARHVLAEMDGAGLHGAVKTSGSSGIHIAIPLPPRITFERSAALATRLAERVVRKHPALATLERSVRKRPRGTIYVDAQQNAHGKSVVSAYSVRAVRAATVSAPLKREELRRSSRMDAYTMRTIPPRLTRVGDVWATHLKVRNDARRIDRVLREDS
jgi:bifunctional non-homologous end joining protein LigD